ncbi:MAG: pyridoxamine 5'-phosphate oxidase family protein [Treponema sp.]|nr:pyridoxamine 5'-phosphate oxidase family protein [Treponema sp.]
MRRKDREKDSSFAMEVISTCEYAVLATVNADGTPYCVPVSPVTLNGFIYFHGAPEGRKFDNIANNPAVCITCVRNVKSVPEKFTTAYESAVVCGSCSVVIDEDEKIKALRAICEKYANSNMDEFDNAVKNMLHRTGIFKITIGQITGKANTG